MDSQVIRESVGDTAVDRKPLMGTLSHDFGLPASPVLRVLGRPNLLPPRISAELGVVAHASRPDAFLMLPPPRRRQRLVPGRIPVLGVYSALLRAPPISSRPTILHSLTLQASDGSRLTGWTERILRQATRLTPAIAERARQLVTSVVSCRVGGTWWGMPARQSTANHGIVFGVADERLTRTMLARAIEQHGASRTLLAMPRPGALAPLCRQLGVSVIPGIVDPWTLIEEAACVHVPGDHEAGLLACLAGTPVRCHSQGPLAPAPEPIRLAAAAFILGARYSDPTTGHPIQCEAFLDQAREWRRQTAGAAEIACCVGISFWKRRRIKEMLGAHRHPAFRRTTALAVAAAVRRQGSLAVWASRVPAGLTERAAAAGIPVMRIEDGFIRSVGLGADFLPPLSIVLDRLGLYYDATAPSDLEAILAGSRFDPALLRRAASLRARLVRERVTKYNLDHKSAVIAAAADRRILLVPGQVADDRSVLLGGAGVRPGIPLLELVRRREPQAFIVYKPHPDVDAGHRAGAVPDADALRFADQILRGGSMAALLDQIDEVHTLTSLTGFEALLRGIPVTTYGQPFYAGWGLTADANPVARRSRRLTIDELVAATLILYPKYIDPLTGLPCAPETVIDRIADPGLHRPNLLVMARRLQGRLFDQLRPTRSLANPLQKGASR